MPLRFSSPAISLALCWHHAQCPLPSREGCAKRSFPDLLGWRRGEPRQCAGRGAPVPPWAAEGSLCLAQGAAETDAQRVSRSFLQRTSAFWLSGCLSIGIYMGKFKKSRGIRYVFFWAVAFVGAVCRKTKGFPGSFMLCCWLVPAQPGSCTRAFGSLCFWSPCNRHRR